MESEKQRTRVAIFIDNSNVLHNILDTMKDNPQWVRLYDPLQLATKLSGGRQIVYIGFYCVRPPSYLLTGTEQDIRRYKTSMQYYSAIEKLPSVTVKYGDLRGVQGELQEKNVDTQIATDMVMQAALNQYDTAILVSNDGDYVSAVENTRVFKKKVEVVFFKGRLSMALRRISDLTRRVRISFFVKINL